MKKYYLIGKGVIDEILIDRVNFLVWRFRIVISVLIGYFLWTALLSKQATISGYNTSLMLTYILFGSIVASFVFNSRSFTIGDDINQGNLSNALLRPYNYFLGVFSSDIADKVINVLFSIIELTILFFILKPPIIFQTNSFILFLTVVAICVSIVMYFFFGLLLGAVGFWSAEVWGPRFIFGVLITLLSGQLFPVDLLPKPLFVIVQFLPFTYLIYFPTKIYLGQLPLQQIVFGLGVGIVWSVILYGCVKIVWKNGLRKYTAQGS